ncbi:ABC transporter permease [Candidatus Pacearchaeota archaeon]|nr:ABC transporter permease [Candidatus Pacearchaeota archaeon]
MNISSNKPIEENKPPGKSWIEILFYIFCGLILLFLIIPLFIVIPISFSSATYLEFPPSGYSLKWYKNFFGHDVWITALINSIKIGVMTSVLACLLGIPTALTLTRKKIKGKNIIYSFLISPMIVPVIIIAIGVFFHFSKLKLIGNIYTIVLAHTVLAIPVVLITVSASLQGFDKNLEYAAMSLGANRFVTFFKITFPLIQPGIISGALFAFITSFDEPVIAFFLSSYRSLTLPKHMWGAIREQIDPTIAVCSSLLIVTAIFLLISVAVVSKRAERLRG